MHAACIHAVLILIWLSVLLHQANGHGQHNMPSQGYFITLCIQSHLFSRQHFKVCMSVCMYIYNFLIENQTRYIYCLSTVVNACLHWYYQRLFILWSLVLHNHCQLYSGLMHLVHENIIKHAWMHVSLDIAKSPYFVNEFVELHVSTSCRLFHNKGCATHAWLCG